MRRDAPAQAASPLTYAANHTPVPESTTRVWKVWVLSAGAGSDSGAATVTTLDSSVPLAGVPVTVTSTVTPGASAPRSQLINPAEMLHEPCDAVAESTVSPSGIVEVSVTSDAVAGPPLTTKMRCVSGLPATAGSGEFVW